MSTNKPTNRTDWIAKARLILALPSATVAILELHKVLPPFWIPIVKITAYLILLWVCVSGVVSLWRRYVAPTVSRWFATAHVIAHLNQSEARLQAKHYVSRLRLDPLLLAMGVPEFAREADLPLWQAWAILRNPDVIVRPEIQECVEKALLLPEGFFSRGGAKDGTKYGDAMTRARLQRYFDLGIVKVYLKRRDPRMRTARSRAQLLHKCENELIRGLVEEGRWEGGD